MYWFIVYPTLLNYPYEAYGPYENKEEVLKNLKRKFPGKAVTVEVVKSEASVKGVVDYTYEQHQTTEEAKSEI